MTLTPQWLDELRARVALSGVIGRTTRLIKAGREFKACCPFHDEKTPSFTVNDDKGFYHCFGCGAHGDVIRWMTDQRGLGFMDAVKELATEAGMELPAPDPKAAQAAEQRASLHDVMAAAQGWFVANLAISAGAPARAYLAQRGLSAETIARFGFGWAPDDRQALRGALKQFPDEMLVEAGLRIVVDDPATGSGRAREPYDRFRNRITLPIADARGRTIGFGGRILGSGTDGVPKYLNSPDTVLFDKGATLFNLDRAAPIARKTRRLIVVEGYMDVVALSAAGIGECVAPMGTALTERQLELLWRQVETPILCFDGDAAGQRAAVRAIQRTLPLLRPDHSLRIARLPPGVDPDDLVRQQGTAAVETALDDARSPVDVLWEAERDGEPPHTPEAKAGLKARLLAHAETIADPDIRALYRREWLDRFSAYAFPPRDWSRQNNVVNIGEARRWATTQSGRQSTAIATADAERTSREWSDKHTNLSARTIHLHRRLGAAITAGLIHFPSLTLIYAQTILEMNDADPRLQVIVEAALDRDVLEPDQLPTILTKEGFAMPGPDEWDNLRLPFTWPPSGVEDAADGIERAIRLYAGLPQVEAALQSATDRLAREFTDGNFLEQQRLLKRALALKGELRQMATAA